MKIKISTILLVSLIAYYQQCYAGNSGSKIASGGEEDYLRSYLGMPPKASSQSPLPTSSTDSVNLDSDKEKKLLELAQQGDAQAKYDLAMFYRNGGSDIPRSTRLSKFTSLLKEAAVQEHTEAQATLARVYLDVEKIDPYLNTLVPKTTAETLEEDYNALQLVNKLKDKENAKGQYLFGCIYKYGRCGFEKDENVAFTWFLKAAEQGLEDAQAAVGQSYMHGSGVLKDEKEALKWALKAAEQGNASAQCNIGFAYDHGTGVPKNEDIAIVWYRKATEQGDAAAQNNLNLMKNHKKSLKLEKNKNSSIQGNINALYQLSRKW